MVALAGVAASAAVAMGLVEPWSTTVSMPSSCRAVAWPDSIALHTSWLRPAEGGRDELGGVLRGRL
jgi:hypothetical protein